MADIDLVYKLIVLRILDRVDFAVSNVQITTFFTEYGYTDYFKAQLALNDVADSSLANVTKSHGNTSYTLSSEGKKTLELFIDRITEDIDSDITSYLNDNELRMKEEQSVVADYFPVEPKGYTVNCKIVNNSTNRTTYEVNCFVPTKEQAEAICNNWKAKYEKMYLEFLDELTS